MKRVAMHIKARWYEVRSDMIWRRYLDTRDAALRDRAYALFGRAQAIRKAMRGAA